MRVAHKILVAVLTPVSAATAQWSGGIGPVGQLSSNASTWHPSALLWGTGRLEQPNANVDVTGSVTGGAGVLRMESVAARQRFFSPARAGLRLVTSIDLASRAGVEPAGAKIGAISSISYRNGLNGGWVGIGANRGLPAALRLGGWRQLGSGVTVAISSSLRRGTYGGSPSRTWTGTVWDTIPTDTAIVIVPRSATFGDSGSPGRRLTWAETEARVGWARGRFALDGVIGWRPAIDTAPRATWFRAISTIGVSKAVSLSAGVGTTMNQVPYSRSAGRYATVAVRLAPAALVRPRETPEITPAAAAFAVERIGEQFVVRVRVPHARTVELSGDFNGWQPVRLAQEKDGLWTVALPLRPGAYRMNIRVDGERWLPPPGTAAVDDEFNGKVGLVVVR